MMTDQALLRISFGVASLIFELVLFIMLVVQGHGRRDNNLKYRTLVILVLFGNAASILVNIFRVSEHFHAFLSENENDCFNIRAFGFWLCHLADFGDKEAIAKIEASPGIHNITFMGGMHKQVPSLHAVSTSPIINPRFPNVFYYPGKIDSLRMGLLDVYKANGAILSWSESDKAYTGNEHAGNS